MSSRLSIDKAFLRRSDLTATEKGLLMVILGFTNGKRECRPTRAQLSEASGFAPNTLENHLRTLRIKGLLNMHQVRDEEGKARTMFIPFPPNPERVPYLKKWGKDHI